MRIQTLKFSSLLLLLFLLPSCANSPLGQSLQDSIQADPRLLENSPTPTPNPTVSPTSIATLPSDFPEEIPRYPNAELLAVNPETQDNSQLTRWRSSDPVNEIQQFYRQALTEQNWQISNPEQTTLKATRNNLELTIVFPTLETLPTEFELTYTRQNQPIAASPNPTPTPNSEPVTEGATPQVTPYLEDLISLNVISNGEKLKPNQPITRREFARWLLTTNNRFYADNPGKQIRLASPSAQPAFQDISSRDADFAVIQGLAEAGIIPSRLSGDTTVTTFRPDAPLTREQMVLWKVPLDSRKALPNATVESIKETWGFQDTGKINPKVLRAILADYQNGDNANIRRAFGFTTLFLPTQPVTQAEAAAALWYFGYQGEGVSAAEVKQTPNN